MIRSLTQRLNDRRTSDLEGEEVDAGFTLIELMVVLLIMAILLAIAIPTFLGVKGGAQDRAAQSNLNTALTNAKAVYGNNQTYGTTDSAIVSSLQQSEASLTFAGSQTASTGQNHISVGVNTSSTSTDNPGNGLILAVKSASGVCWGIMTNEVASLTGNIGNSSTTWPSQKNGSGTQAGTFYISWKGTCSASSVTGTWTQNNFPNAA